MPKRPRRTRNLPPRHLWPRLKQPAHRRPSCEHCGTPMRSASTQKGLTYYRAVCLCRKRPLKKVERPIDWAAMRERFILDEIDV